MDRLWTRLRVFKHGHVWVMYALDKNGHARAKWEFRQWKTAIAAVHLLLGPLSLETLLTVRMLQWL